MQQNVVNLNYTIIRGTTPTFNLKIPNTLSQDLIEDVCVVFSQRRPIISLSLADCTLENQILSFTLTQQQTYALRALEPVYIQINVLATGGQVVASYIFGEKVGENLCRTPFGASVEGQQPNPNVVDDTNSGLNSSDQSINVGFSQEIKVTQISLEVDDSLSETSENPVQNKVITGAINEIKGNISTIEGEVSTNADNISALTERTSTTETTVDDIQSLIPNQASEENPLADKNFVNSSIQTATANFRGNWATWAEVPSISSGYPVDYRNSRIPTVNDYLVVQNASDYTGSQTLEGTWRFKYNGVWETDGKNGWLPEYQVNETPLTAEQLAALNSGMTANLTAKLQNDTLSLSAQTLTAEQQAQVLTNLGLINVAENGQ